MLHLYTALKGGEEGDNVCVRERQGYPEPEENREQHQDHGTKMDEERGTQGKKEKKIIKMGPAQAP